MQTTARRIRGALAGFVLLCGLGGAARNAEGYVIFTSPLERVVQASEHVVRVRLVKSDVSGLDGQRPKVEILEHYRGAFEARRLGVRGVPDCVLGAWRQDLVPAGLSREEVVVREAVLGLSELDGRFYLTGRRPGLGVTPHASIALLGENDRVYRYVQTMNPGLPVPVQTTDESRTAFLAALKLLLRERPFTATRTFPSLPPHERERFYAIVDPVLDWYARGWKRDATPSRATILEAAARLERYVDDAPADAKLAGFDALLLLVRRHPSRWEHIEDVQDALARTLPRVDRSQARDLLLAQLAKGRYGVGRTTLLWLARQLGPDVYDEARRVLVALIERQNWNEGTEAWHALRNLGEEALADAAQAAFESRERRESEDFISLVSAMRTWLDLTKPGAQTEPAFKKEWKTWVKRYGGHRSYQDRVRTLPSCGRPLPTPWKSERIAGAPHLRHVVSEHGTLSFSVPEQYGPHRAAPPRRRQSVWKARARALAFHPRPLRILLPAEGDPTGAAARIERRLPRKANADTYAWQFVLALDPAGDSPAARLANLDACFDLFVRHYGVLFAAVGVDGGLDALRWASSRPSRFQHVALRAEGLEASDILPYLPNLRGIPIGLDADGALRKALKSGGWDGVPDRLGGMMTGRWRGSTRTRRPKQFRYEAVGLGFRHAWWIRLDEVDGRSAKPTVEVEILDTIDAPNTVSIHAVGVKRLSVYLDGDLVDLNRAVRVTVNGVVVHEGKPQPSMTALPSASADVLEMFEGAPHHVRETRHYDALYPVRLLGLKVP